MSNSMQTQTGTVMRDQRGRPLFICQGCGGELVDADVMDHGLRLPDIGETRDEYFDAELIDELGHVACERGRAAG